MAVYKNMRYYVAYPPSPRPNVAMDVENYINNKKTSNNTTGNRGRNSGGAKTGSGKKKKETKRTKVVSAVRNMNPMGRYRLSACAAKFALAACDPFNPKAVGVCLPTLPAQRSQKVARFLRGTFVIGTLGVGYVAIAPCLVNDYACVYSTNANYANSALVLRAGTAAIAGVDFVPVPGPWSSTEVLTGTTSNSVRGRIVTAGVSAQYSGSLLNQGGQYVGLVQPQHDELFNVGTTVTPATVASYREAYFKPNCGQRVVLSAIPINNMEEAYSHEFALSDTGVNSGTAPAYPLGASSTNNMTAPVIISADPIMVIAVTGGVAGSVYTFEVVLHCEYVGRPVAAVSTASEADVVGYQAVSTAAQKLPEELGNRGASFGDKAAHVMDTLIENEHNLMRGIYTVSSLAGAAIRGFTAPGLTRIGG